MEQSHLIADKSPAKAKDAQARLILQDPGAFDQAIQPSLRSSTELRLEDVPALERESARELWENLSLEPAQAQMQQADRKRLRTRVEALVRESDAAKAELATLQAQTTQERDNRWNHPIIYAGAAGLIGLSALWLLERRKRVQLHNRELGAWAQPMPTSSLPYAQSEPSALPSQPAVTPSEDFRIEKVNPPLRASAQGQPIETEAISIYEMEDLPDLADDYATDLPGLLQGQPQTKARSRANDASSAEQLAKVADDPQAEITSVVPPDWAVPRTAYDFVDPKSEQEFTQESLLNKSRRLLRHMFQRKSERDLASLSHVSTEIATTAAHTSGMPSTLLRLEEVHEAAQRVSDGKESAYDPDRANIELLSQTRIKPQSRETAVEHLLELRTAVSGLSVLGRPEGALALMSDHVDAHPDTCAWAYLEHMQLCERLDLRDDFESMRKRYRAQFNRMAPYWHEPNSNVLGLDGYARAASELCSAWGQGRDAALAMISAWLIGPILGRKLVQLPAYDDLFDLYELLEFAPENLDVHPTNETLEHDVHARLSTQDASVSDMDFVPTVSLLDLDYEFSSDVTLEEKEVQEAARSVTIVKSGNFLVDFNVAGTQMGVLPSIPAELSE
jgi:hypothetical protein